MREKSWQTHSVPSGLRNQDGQKVLWDQGTDGSFPEGLWEKKSICHRMRNFTHYSKNSFRPKTQQWGLCCKHLTLLQEIWVLFWFSTPTLTRSQFSPVCAVLVLIWEMHLYLSQHFDSLEHNLIQFNCLRSRLVLEAQGSTWRPGSGHQRSTLEVTHPGKLRFLRFQIGKEGNSNSAWKSGGLGWF